MRDDIINLNMRGGGGGSRVMAAAVEELVSNLSVGLPHWRSHKIFFYCIFFFVNSLWQSVLTSSPDIGQ